MAHYEHIINILPYNRVNYFSRFKTDVRQIFGRISLNSMKWGDIVHFKEIFVHLPNNRISKTLKFQTIFDSFLKPWKLTSVDSAIGSPLLSNDESMSWICEKNKVDSISIWFNPHGYATTTEFTTFHTNKKRGCLFVQNCVHLLRVIAIIISAEEQSAN